MRYFIIAGEASGDLHGSNLIRGLLAEDPGAEIRFYGGAMMEAAGGLKLSDYKDTAVMGLGDVIAKLGTIRRRLGECKKQILAWNPDAVVLIDYPGFNMKIAKFCHDRGIRVFYYIAPKTWASRERRNAKLKAWVDRLFIVFPFEVPFFSERGIPFTYKGNPLIDAVDGHDFVRPEEGHYIAILAGSRKGEIARTMPNAVRMAEQLHALPEYEGYRFLVAGAPSRTAEDYAAYTVGHPYIEVLFGRTYDILKFADAALINSGTASLEAALIGTPQVVCWSTSYLTARIAKYVFRVLDHVRFISLGNLILDKGAFRELLQDDFTPEEAGAEIRRLIEDAPYREAMLADYAEIRSRLGGSGASRAVARAMVDELKG